MEPVEKEKNNLVTMTIIHVIKKVPCKNEVFVTAVSCGPASCHQDTSWLVWERLTHSLTMDINT